MARTRIKCHFILYCLIVSVSARSLPEVHISTSITEDTYTVYNAVSQDVADNTATSTEKEIKYVINGTSRNDRSSEVVLQNNIRPGQQVRSYAVSLTRDGGNMIGRAVVDVILTADTMGNPIRLYANGLDIQSVEAGIMTEANPQPAQFNPANNLEILPAQRPAGSFALIIEYTVQLRDDGRSIYIGQIDEEEEYIAMNLYPTNARRVFPSMDEPNLHAMTTFSFNGMQFNTLLSNSMLDVDSTTTFRPLDGPVHLWAMVAHSMNMVTMPIMNTFLYARQGVVNQDALAAVAISNYFTALNAWTEKPHDEIILNQNGGLHVMAVPDVSRDWYGLSTLCIWEPYIFMENNGAVKQRKTILVTLAEGIARQWFGYVLHPLNWRYQWVIAGLGNYAAYEVARDFQTPPQGQEDDTLLDMNTIFTTDVIQESLLYDAYASTQPLEPGDDLFEENEIRLLTMGVLKTKAPAVLRMTMLVLSEQRDIVQASAKAILRSRTVEAINSRNIYDMLHSEYSFGIGGSGLVGVVDEFMRPWIENNGYPFIHIGLRPGGVVVTQERFGFSQRAQINYVIPITFTTSINPNFGNIHPTEMVGATTTLNIALGEEDWVLFNLQGQGYYRVNYDAELWERIIETLEDEETREDIHPLNRATLVDDSLNLARAGRLDYGTAFEVVLTMELEKDYAVWKAFVRNMEFLMKRLEAYVHDDDDLDPDIYLRMVRRTIETVEEEIGFEPEGGLEPSMISLTRGLVMTHACRARYDPCIAAAVDWFYDDDEEEVNPDIPHEIRPAVYCTMVREDEEGEDEVVETLLRRLEIEQSRYERLVILESLACSPDNRYIAALLEETVDANTPYVVEERSKIFAAVAGSTYENSGIALNFLMGRTNAIRDMYGGPEKLDEAIFVMAENIVTAGQSNEFVRWVNSVNSNLGDSILAAQRAVGRIEENLIWLNDRMEDAYEWIDENDASTVYASTFLLCLTLFIALFNQN